MLKVVLATTNVFFSLVLGALAMGVVWYLAPDLMQGLFQSASGMKAWLVSRGISAKYNVFLWFLIEERQLVYMGFVLATRVVMSILTTFLVALFWGDR